MALVTLKEILAGTRKGGYAVGGFNFNGREDAQGIINAAVETRSPVILMISMRVCKYMGIEQSAGMIAGMAKAADIPVCLQLDHTFDTDYAFRAVKAGFTSIMVDASALEYEENIRMTKEVVDFARDYNCSVEAELGNVGGKPESVATDDLSSTFTNPADVERFVAETGIDALAIAFGSCHGFYKSEPKLDFGLLERIAKLTDCPLVLHGGSGISDDDFRRCIKLGLSKINIGTEFKAAFAQTLRKVCAELPPSEVDPQIYMAPVRDACAEIAKHKIDIFGSAGRV